MFAALAQEEEIHMEYGFEENSKSLDYDRTCPSEALLVQGSHRASSESLSPEGCAR